MGELLDLAQFFCDKWFVFNTGQEDLHQ